LEKNWFAIVLVIVVIAGTGVAAYQLVGKVPTLTIQTTTSLNDSGLLDILKPAFESQYTCDMRWVAVGTGQALTNAALGEADLVMVHSPSNELWFVNHTDPAETDSVNSITYAGYGIMRVNFAYNYFLIVGPVSDPLHIYGNSTLMNSPNLIFQKIYTFGQNGTPGIYFASRADASGTNSKEVSIWTALKLWNSTGKSSTYLGWPKNVPKTGNTWYLATGQGMGATLQIADQKGAYTLTDYATWLKMEAQGVVSSLEVVSNTTIPSLKNIYSVIAVDPNVVPTANFVLARKFIYWMATKGIDVVGNYTIDGQHVFTVYLNYTRTSPSGSPLDDVYNGTFASNLGNPSFQPVSSPTASGAAVAPRLSTHSKNEIQ
jgi:tungstate transport system substrate-binding protein